MSHHIASCSCGGLTVTCRSEPLRVSVCHCLECQKRTGSAFSVNARFAAEAVEISGASSTYTRRGDSGKNLTFHFCPACGSTLHWTLEDLPGMVAVAVGAFADPAFPPPHVSVYEDRKHGWVKLPQSVTEHHR